MKYPFFVCVLILIFQTWSLCQSNDAVELFLRNRNPVEQARTSVELQQQAMHKIEEITTADFPKYEYQKEHLFVKRLVLASELAMPTNGFKSISLKKRSTNTGAIEGTVRIAGIFNFDRVDMLAFNELGYCLGAATVNPADGYYCIEDLPAGSYYLISKSNYIDEFYNNIISWNFANWRSAELVAVSQNSPTLGVDFDLDRGPIITGKVMDVELNAPIQNRFVTFYLFSSQDKKLVDSCMTFLEADGIYSFTYHQTGTYAIQCSTSEYEDQFYAGQISIDDATPVEIQSLSQTTANIDFALKRATAISKGAISGMVYESETNQPLELVEIIAESKSEPCVLWSTFSMFDSGSFQPFPAGSFRLDDLPEDSYTVWAVDFFGGHATEYFRDAEFERDAMPVTVVNAQITEGIDFTLSQAGKISGKIINESGEPVDSIFVLAVYNKDTQIPEYLVDQFINGYLYYGQTDENGQFNIVGLPAGKYAVQTYSYQTQPGEFIDHPYTAPVTIANGSHVEDIDFILYRAGAIIGKILDAILCPINGEIDAYVFNSQTGNFEFFTEFNVSGSEYRISGLDTGEYSVFFDLSTQTAPYVSQFYDGHTAFNLTGAKNIPVVRGEETKNIDVTISLGGTINGHLYLPNGLVTGADTLKKTLIILYDVSSAEYVMDKSTTFCGGYEIKGIPAGMYKLCAFATTTDGAVSYYGGGETFHDAKSKTIEMRPNEIYIADMTMFHANARINGRTVKDSDFSPLNFVYILAYDESGHAVSFGVSGVQLENDRFLGDGNYSIHSLRPGSYFLRSWFIFSLHPFFTTYLDAHYNQECYDEWYQDVRIEPHVVPNSFAYYKMYFAPPFFCAVHPNAAKLTIPDPNSVAEDIVFELDPIENAQLTPEKAQIVSDFVLYQNIPNPFNPDTEIRYDLGDGSHITLSIYNIMGEKITDLVDTYQVKGTYSVVWSGQDVLQNKVSSGVYFCILQCGLHRQIKKMALID